MARKPGKSETLTIRLDPKTRFMLEFVARLRGQSITTVVERAVQDAADDTRVQIANSNYTANWKDYWSVIEGERMLNIAKETELRPTYDEEKLLQFTKTHWPFFYTSKAAEAFRPGLIEVLWPKIDEFLNIYEQNKTVDYFAAGKAMQSALKAANVAPPEWPIEKISESNRVKAPPFDSSSDDDIPF